jgi:TonB family protein
MLRPREQRAKRPPASRIAAAVLGSALLHVLIVGLVVLTSHVEWRPSAAAAKKSGSNSAVTVRRVSSDAWERNRGQTQSRVSPAPKKQTKKEDSRKPDEIPKGQIVAVAPGNGQVDPNARFIAETNNVAKRQQRAKEQTAFYRNAMPQRTSTKPVEAVGDDPVEQALKSGNDGRADDDRPLVEQQAAQKLEIPKSAAHQEIALKQSETTGPGVSVANRPEQQEVAGNSSRLNVQPGALGPMPEGSMGRIGQKGVLNLMPSAAVVDRIVGAAPNDHLRDVEEGDATFLSTREWKYASFFNRVKQSIGQRWTPQDQLRMRDPSGQIYGGKDRYTILTVTLDEAGRLKDAFVDRSSGVDFLDLEAIRAFERAQPFPNPPPGLLAADQTVRFQFGFFLEMSGRPGLRLFRSAQ